MTDDELVKDFPEEVRAGLIKDVRALKDREKLPKKPPSPTFLTARQEQAEKKARHAKEKDDAAKRDRSGGKGPFG